jgi:hypothetical protein
VRSALRGLRQREREAADVVPGSHCGHTIDAMNPDELYGLPLEKFVPERNALARSLRSSGERAEGDRVAALRKPSVSAWAVNQVVRTQAAGVRSLFAAGDAVQQAQTDLLGGRGDAAELREAAEAVREGVDSLVDAARGLPRSSGSELSQSVVDRVRETLNAAALDEEARAQVGDGCLVRELAHAGLGGFAEVPVPSGGRAPARPRERAAEARKAREAEKSSRRELERAERALEVTEQRRERAAEALREVEEELAAARKRLKAAAQAHEEAARGKGD